jgi:hypothetical protein
VLAWLMLAWLVLARLVLAQLVLHPLPWTSLYKIVLVLQLLLYRLLQEKRYLGGCTMKISLILEEEFLKK